MRARGLPCQPACEPVVQSARWAMAEKQDKAERLAAALRDNLRKRKAQARALSGGAAGDQGKDDRYQG
jgi:hypothetical protein